ncbi:DUF6314 family protein [Pseudooceanicola sp. C21-150M6]|uniref:DUF6314 family protein n=1 Tax=Pseudooceanicola sp. C21-150M6 TaxID=3434355 RepID=UPI003D7F8AC7
MELADFEGSWVVARQIRNAVGPDYVFDGRAVFARDREGLVYREEGQMRTEGSAPMAARRVYLWRQGDAGIEVFFEDGRFFHLIGPGAEVSAGHDCAPDRYDVQYDFRDWPVWSSVWEVSGPRKSYRMESVFRRE